MNTKERKAVKYPLLLKPYLAEHIWGGTRLIDKYNKKTSLATVSEAWEISVNKDFPSVIDNGIYKDISLRDYLEEFPEMLGKNVEEFALLVKLINSSSLLSVQVHPDDIYASANEKQLGKTEAWLILEADEGAFIYLGFKENLTKEQFEQAIKASAIEKLLNKITVKAGQSYIVKAGTIHAIGGGITLLEIQENSSLTYRVYDYNRKDKDGNLRELHINKALDVTNLKKGPELKFKQYNTYLHGRRTKVIAKCNYFTSYLIKGGLSFGFEESSMVTVIDGKGTVISKGDSFDVTKGDSLFIPAGLQCRIMGGIKFVLTL